MKLYAGIDGGQTATVAVIAGEDSRILGRGKAGPCDHVGQAADSPRFARAIEDAVGAALRDAKLAGDTLFEAAVAGISGYEGAIHGITPRLNARRVTYVHDTRIAHAGAFELGDGIIVIAGTGSVAYGRANGKEALTGGWGYLFGDGGSAFWMASTALKVAMENEDKGVDEPLGEFARRFFKRANLREIARAFYVGDIDRPALATFAAELLRIAENGTDHARVLASTGATSLAELVRQSARRLGSEQQTVAVALSGGMFESSWYREQTTRHIEDLVRGARVVPAKRDGLGGALLLAYKEGEGA